MFIGDGIFVILPRNAYLIFTSVSNPPLVGVYGILCYILLVSECVVEDKFVMWKNLLIVSG